MKVSDLIFRARLKLLKPQSNPYAAAAVYGLTHDGFPKEPSMCEKFARKVRERVAGSRFSHLQRPTALQTFHAFREAGYEVPLERGSVPGDFLYKLSGNGGFGHVVTRLAGNVVAENSIVHSGDGDARGIRTLKELGEIDGIIRLPLPGTPDFSKGLPIG